LQNRASRGIAAQLATSLPSGTVPYLSIKGSRFTLFDAAGNERQVGFMDSQVGMALDVCVVDSNPHVSKIYYAKAYDPNADVSLPPDCWSDNGIAPSSQAAAPQHRDCKTCPHNQWGSDTSRITGKSTKACNDVQKVAIAVPGQGDMVFLLRIPPASLKHMAKYIQEIGSFSAGGRKVDICDLVTRVYFDKDAVGILKFTAAGWVDAETAAIADKAYESKATESIVGKLDRPYTGEVGILPAARQVEQRTLAPPAPAYPPIPGQPFLGYQGDVHASDGTNLTTTTVEAVKKRGRPRKEPVQEAPATQAPFLASSPVPSPTLQNGSQSPSEVEDIPNFLKRTPETPPPSVKPPGPSFGMQAATAAPDDMQARIAAVLAMKTGG
jgi:hypothetical protein